MAALTCASMIDEVQALCGRTGDTDLITETQVTRWFNEAQKDIADRIPGLHALTFKNTTSHDTTAVLRYAIGDITGGDYTTQGTAHVWDVWYLDGVDSRRLAFVHTDEFDLEWPDPTHADSYFNKPEHWTRRGQYIEIRPVCSSGYYDKNLRFDGDFYPRDFSNDATVYSDLSEADHLLKDYALSKAWRAIGSAGSGEAAIVRAMDYSRQYEQGLDVYEARNDRLNEWDGNLYSDSIEG